jgi:signal transduction histidine kinase
VMFKSQKISLSSAPFYASLLVILALALFIGIFWAINEYQAHQESIDNIRKNYEEQYKVRVREELDYVVDFINFTRNQTTINTEEELRNRVQSAYTIASHLYSMYQTEKGVDELRSMIAEVLRPIRWYEGRGYYFAGETRTGIIDLFADEPFFEGHNHLRTAHPSGDVINDIIDIVREKGAGIYRYNLIKPAFPDREFSKTSFVKYFQPLDWFIGAGIYNDGREALDKATSLARISQMKFGQGGEIFVFRSDGTIISHKNEQLIGRSIRSLKNDHLYGEQIWLAGTGPTGEGYVNYSEIRQKAQNKLCFVKSYDDWDWVIAASIQMNEMEQLIGDATSTYRRIAFKNVSTFIFLFIVAVSLLLLSAYYYTVKIKQGFNLFTDFFRRAADSKIKIQKEDLAFREFEHLAHLANHMVDDRIRNEQLIHRDELRLDTLLRLGMMEDFSLKDKYNFTLQRIVQITRSEEGYLALVNKKQQHITIISHYLSDGTRVPYPDKRHLSSTVSSGGLAGQTVIRKNAVICNDCTKEQNEAIYPYRKKLTRHLDVPIFNSGLIVLVAGVCNNTSYYDKADIRQMTMVLEGMWLHIVKTRSEKKMGRLERQIIAVREAERSSIGRILHDDLGSHLSGVELLSKALKMSLEKELPQRAEQLEAIRGLIVDATEKTRRLARGLYPVHIIEHGLEAAIEELVVEVEKLFDITCELSFDGHADYIDNSVATHVYYIIREALFNAARHGAPDRIDINVDAQKHHLFVQIIDDGTGFDPSSARRGMGLHTMKYRAKAIGAAFSVESAWQRGTIITVTGDIENQ